MRLTLLPVLSLLTPAFAFAQGEPPPPPPTECVVDADCAEGEFCAPVDCAPPCDPTADPACEPVDCSGTGVCIAAEPPPPPVECTADADCAGDDVCITGTSESCSGEGCVCPDDGDGDPSNDPPCDCLAPAPPECTTETFAFCGPRYLDDCTVDADCGAGFTCDAVDTCVCTAPGAEGDAAAPPDCSCEPSDTRSCVLERVECSDDADCAEGFVCLNDGAEAPCVLEEDGSTNCGANDVAAGGICAPEGFGEAGGVVRGEDNGASGNNDEDEDIDGDVEDEAGITIDCSQAGGRASAPFALLALGLGLLRRRRA